MSTHFHGCANYPLPPNLQRHGTMKGEYHIQLWHGAVPFPQTTPRRVTLPLLPKVKPELERVEHLGVISRVDNPTEWYVCETVNQKYLRRDRVYRFMPRCKTQCRAKYHHYHTLCPPQVGLCIEIGNNLTNSWISYLRTVKMLLQSKTQCRHLQCFPGVQRNSHPSISNCMQLAIGLAAVYSHLRLIIQNCRACTDIE